MIDIQKLADLARISIPEEEKTSIGKDLEAIVGFVDQVQSVNISEEEIKFDEKNVFRDDKVEPLTVSYDLVQASADSKDHFVKVPKVIE